MHAPGEEVTAKHGRFGSRISAGRGGHHAPLRQSRDFRRLWFGTGISAIGSQITTVAIPFQLYGLTHSTLLVGLLGLAALLPLLAVPLWAGAVADPVDRRRQLLLSDVALLLVTVGLLVNALLPEPSIWFLFVVGIAGTAAYGDRRVPVSMGGDSPSTCRRRPSPASATLKEAKEELGRA